MERKIGEIFQTEGCKVQVVEQTYLGNDLCHRCSMHDGKRCTALFNVTGECDSANRIDRKNVIFKTI